VGCWTAIWGFRSSWDRMGWDMLGYMVMLVVTVMGYPLCERAIAALDYLGHGGMEAWRLYMIFVAAQASKHIVGSQKHWKA
jgi:hypothetical protein